VADHTEAPTSFSPVAERARNLAEGKDSEETRRSLLMIILLLITILTLYLGYQVFNTLTQGTDPAITNNELVAEKIFASAKIQSITLDNQNVTEFTEVIKTALGSSSEGLTEIQVMDSSGTEISPARLFELLNLRPEPSLQQTLSLARLIKNQNHETPTLVIRSTDKEVVYGGMLNWERTMKEDFRSLFMLPVNTNMDFVDQSLSNIDVRILQSDGEPVLVYGFATDNIVIITPNTDTFTQLLPLLQSE
jgi:hypothetical protein